MKLLLPALLLSLCSCQTTPTAGWTHVVVFWLKEPGNAAQRAKIIETSESFRKIPGVLSVKAGECLRSTRPVVDISYDVAVAMEFSDREAMQHYLEHPVHTAASDGILKPLVKKVVVYDFGRE